MGISFSFLTTNLIQLCLTFGVLTGTPPTLSFSLSRIIDHRLATRTGFSTKFSATRYSTIVIFPNWILEIHLWLYYKTKAKTKRFGFNANINRKWSCNLFFEWIIVLWIEYKSRENIIIYGEIASAIGNMWQTGEESNYSCYIFNASKRLFVFNSIY